MAYIKDRYHRISVDLDIESYARLQSISHANGRTSAKTAKFLLETLIDIEFKKRSLSQATHSVA